MDKQTKPEDFTKKEYWNKFSSNLGKIQFEWYGKWNEISKIMHKYVKPTDNTLHVGIGNSDMAAKFHDILFVKNQLAIDISDKAVKFQEKKFQGKREIIYKTADVTTLTTAESKTGKAFNVIVDKGTLDAILPESGTSTQIASKMFENIFKNLLAPFGRYMIISLSQNQVAEFIIKEMEKYPNIAIKMHVSNITKIQNKYNVPVFVYTFIKFLRIHFWLESVWFKSDRLT